MNLAELENRIAGKRTKIGVIGLGYVGLPVACSFARAGFSVAGVDVLQERVDKINTGISPIEGKEPGLSELISEVVRTNKLQTSTDYAILRDCDFVLIAVETPVGSDNKPQYKALRACLTQLGKVLKRDAIVIIESTIAPGTTKKIVVPMLEESSGWQVNQGFYLGHCPERVMPGKLLSNLAEMSRAVGGMNAETAQAMVTLYREIIPTADLDATDCVTAEIVKTAENTYRDVQIAFANEVAMICEAVGGDVWKVRELVNKSPGRHMLMPGAGVGGHCIPKDPWLLAYGVDQDQLELKLIPAARNVNDAMPMHILELLENALAGTGKTLKKSKILVLGYSYLENSDDIRNSPSASLMQLLKQAGAQAVVHDPYVEEFSADLASVAPGCDAAVLMVKHQEYIDLGLPGIIGFLQDPIFIDGRGVFHPNQSEAGLIYRAIGVGGVYNSP